MVAENGVDKL